MPQLRPATQPLRHRRGARGGSRRRRAAPHGDQLPTEVLDFVEWASELQYGHYLESIDRLSGSRVIHLISDKIFDTHSIILGKTGAGKSSVARLQVERLLDLGVPVTI